MIKNSGNKLPACWNQLTLQIYIHLQGIAALQNFMSTDKALNPKSQITGLKNHECNGMKNEAKEL